MIGCIAKAAASELHPDMDEMDDVRWVHKDIVKQAVHTSAEPDHPYLGTLRSIHILELISAFVPYTPVQPCAVSSHLKATFHCMLQWSDL